MLKNDLLSYSDLPCGTAELVTTSEAVGVITEEARRFVTKVLPVETFHTDSFLLRPGLQPYQLRPENVPNTRHLYGEIRKLCPGKL